MRATCQLQLQGCYRSGSCEGSGLTAANARLQMCVVIPASQEQHLADVVEVSVRRGLLGKELLVSIEHDMQIKLLFQQHEAMVAEALDGAHGSNFAHPVCLKQDDCQLSLLTAASLPDLLVVTTPSARKALDIQYALPQIHLQLLVTGTAALGSGYSSKTR